MINFIHCAIIRTHTQTQKHTHTHIHTYIYIYVCVCVCVCVCKYAHKKKISPQFLLKLFVFIRDFFFKYERSDECFILPRRKT